MKVYYSKITDQNLSKIKFDPVEVAEIDWRDIGRLRQMLNESHDEKTVHSAPKLWPSAFDKIESDEVWMTFLFFKLIKTT